LAIASLLGFWYLFHIYKVDPRYTLLAILFFSLHYVGPFRQNAISPINVDMSVYFFEILFLILFLRQKYLWLMLATPIAIACKELFLALAIILFCVALIWRIVLNDRKYSIPWMLSILFIALLTKFILNFYFPSDAPGRNSILVMAFHTREMLLNPDHILRWLLSLFAALGAFIFLLVKRQHFDFKHIDHDQLLVHVLSLSVLALSILGGMDYTRLIFLGFPYLMLSIFLLGKNMPREIALAFLLSIVITRFWKSLPQTFGDPEVHGAWMPEYANWQYLIYWSIAGALCLMVFLATSFLMQKISGDLTVRSHQIPKS
jgi:hypothetical protein